jgi:type IV pilus assembly protein PilM
MEFLPTTLGTRPRLAVEVRPEGVVAARAEDATALLTALGRADLAEGALAPGLKPGNLVDRAAVVAAVRSALDGVVGRGAERGGARSKDVTLVVPDAAVRVLLLDFDQLPSKIAEALPVVRFRLKKLLPFDADDAMVSYQVMSSTKGVVRVVAVAMPKEVLAEYEAAVISAGYLPGAVLPSTLAALAGLEEAEAPVLVVNAGRGAVTTAIVRAGILLLHRSVDMGGDVGGNVTHTEAVEVVVVTPLPLVDRESSAQEWAQQEALGPGGYDRLDAQASMQTTVLAMAEIHDAETAAVREVTQAVSVAAAYFEDTLEVTPEVVLSAGTLGADALAEMMDASGLEGLRVREVVDGTMMETGAVSASVPRGWLAGVRGALKN